jgi:hypothetical protein
MQHEHPGQPIASKENPEALFTHELTSILAIIAYVADCHNVSVYLVREMLKAHFSISDVMELPRQSFEPAVVFLIDLQVDRLLN